MHLTAPRGQPPRTALMLRNILEYFGKVPHHAEPLFLNLNAAVEFVPVMSADDLRKGLTAASNGKG
jgi:hypothetical protein